MTKLLAPADIDTRNTVTLSLCPENNDIYLLVLCWCSGMVADWANKSTFCNNGTDFSHYSKKLSYNVRLTAPVLVVSAFTALTFMKIIILYLDHCHKAAPQNFLCQQNFRQGLFQYCEYQVIIKQEQILKSSAENLKIMYIICTKKGVLTLCDTAQCINAKILIQWTKVLPH